MNFLSICKNVHLKSGVQGAISTVAPTSNPPYLVQRIASAVQEAWVNIQLMEEDWEFMRKKHSLFHTGVTPKTTYTTADVFTAYGLPIDISTYEDGKRGSIFYDNKPLSYIKYLDLPYVDNTKASKPKWYSYNPSNNDLILNLTDDDYYIDIYYRKTAQILTLDSDIPLIPEDYHHLIQYEALRIFCLQEGIQEIFENYTQDFDRLKVRLYRQFKPRRYIQLNGGLA